MHHIISNRICMRKRTTFDAQRIQCKEFCALVCVGTTLVPCCDSKIKNDIEKVRHSGTHL